MLSVRHSWLWGLLPPDCHTVLISGDAPLAADLADVGLRAWDATSEGWPPRDRSFDAVIVGLDSGATDADLRSALAYGSRSRLVAVSVYGGSSASAPERPTWRRIAQLAWSPVATVKARGSAREVAALLRGAGLRTQIVPTGDRSRKHGIGRGYWRLYRRPIEGALVLGVHGPMTSTAEEVASIGSARLARPLSGQAGVVQDSGKLIFQLKDKAGNAFLMHIAGPPLDRQLQRSCTAVTAIHKSQPPAQVADRIVLPEASGRIGLAAYSIERKVRGSIPWRLEDVVWGECVDFLIGLHSIQRHTTSESDAVDWRAETAAIATAADPALRSEVDALGERLGAALAPLSLGWAHGDFWIDNLLVRERHLAAVLDWEWATSNGLPLFDLFDLIAHPVRRLRHPEPAERTLRILLPLARAGGDRTIRRYCAATGTPSDASTLTCLAIAYWATRVRRQLAQRQGRAPDAAWIAENVNKPVRIFTNLLPAGPVSDSPAAAHQCPRPADG